MSNMQRGARRGCAGVIVAIVFCTVQLLSTQSYAGDYYEGQAAIKADQSVISIRQDVWGLVFDTTCNSCKSQYPEWMFLGDLKVDSLILETGTSPVTQSSEMEQISINNPALLSILESTNTFRLSKYFPLEVPGDTLWWDPVRAVWKDLPDLSQHYYIEFDSLLSVQSVVDQLVAIPELKLAEPCAKPLSEIGDACDYGVTEWIPNDFPDQAWYAGWHLKETHVHGVTTLLGMNAVCAWGMLPAGERGNVRIGVVEQSVVCAEHPDLNAVNVGQVWVPGGPDELDHATKSAGAAAAMGDNYPETGIKTIGVAPDAEIYGFRVGSMPQDMVLAADPRDYDCAVVLMPYTFLDPTDVWLEACQAVAGFGKPLVVTAGNIEPLNPPFQGYPASWDHLTVSVGGTDRFGQRHRESNYTPPGSPSVLDFMAPGELIITTKPPGTYTTVGGTCAAAALTTGLIALALSVNPNLTPADIESCLEGTAITEDVQGYNPEEHGAGRLDAFEAIYDIAGALSCCEGKVGDVNGLGGDTPTIGDVAMLIDHLFISGLVIDCMAEADVNQSGGLYPTEDDLSIADITVKGGPKVSHMAE